MRFRILICLAILWIAITSYAQDITIEPVYILEMPEQTEPLRDDDIKEIRIAFFQTMPHDTDMPMSEDEFEALVTLIQEEANREYEKCGVQFVMEAAQIIAVPEHLLTVQGNQVGSYGGHPPEDVTNYAQWNYDENNTLTDDTRELFSYARDYVSQHTIALFGVSAIDYYIGSELLSVVGLSFAPNSYHQESDYPLRNSLLVTPIQHDVSQPLDYDIMASILTHELAHTLINNSRHTGEYENAAMNTIRGVGYQSADVQCKIIRENIDIYFRGEGLIDAGRPE